MQNSTQKRNRRVRRTLEALEQRRLLAADAGDSFFSQSHGPLPPSNESHSAQRLADFIGPLEQEDGVLVARFRLSELFGSIDFALDEPVEVNARVVGDVLQLTVPQLDTSALLAAAMEKQHREKTFSFASKVDTNIDASVDGIWLSANNGVSTWSASVSSPGARSLNLGFEEYVMPVGGELRIYGEGGDAYVFDDSANEAHGELWTPIILGDSLTIEVAVPESSVSDLSLELGSINHGFRSHQGGEKIGGDTSGACNIDVICDADDIPGIGASIDQYRDEISSVGAYTLGGVDTCSGALVNNTAQDGTPYFLTANHCGISAANAASMVVYWNFECPTCRQPGSADSGGVGNGPLNQFNTGAILRANNAASDFALVELDDPVDPSYEIFYSGWDRSGAEATTAVAIHHPAVAEKRISFEFDATTTTSYYGTSSPGAGTHVRVADWDAGTTEGGSSGSPLYDQNRRIIGQLHGGDAACGNDDSDWYGRLSVSWNGGGTAATRLSDWLDPLGSGVTTLDGLGAGEDFGDAPDVPYGTLLANNGPRHTVSSLRLGTTVGSDADGKPNATATGDNFDDGIRMTAPIVVGNTATLEVTSPSGGGVLDFFFDFDGTGGFGNQPNEIFSQTLSGGTEFINVNVPAAAIAGPTFARFRISSAGGLGPNGPADDGEVEDYLFPVFANAPSLDFGDAPSSLGYATTLANDGPRHAVTTGPQLGSTNDAEPDGQPNETSTGDGRDDDGVIFRAPLVVGQTVDIGVVSGGGMLDYFFDFDADGVFGNQSSEVFSAVLAGGEETVSVTVPTGATIGTSHARFRISSTGDLDSTGFAGDGEVEDYQIEVIEPVRTTIENFDAVAAGSLPTGWTTSSTGSNPWTTVSGGSDSAPNHAFVADIDSASNSTLTSPAIAVPVFTEPVTLSFRNYYETESTYDGGVLEISIGGGGFQDIIAAGGEFLSGGYNGTLDNQTGNPIGGRQAWSGNSGGYISTEISLPATTSGQNIQLRWRMGTDTSVPAIGWRVDTITLATSGFNFDFGDAPTSFPTLLADNGARHVFAGPSLGPSVDVDQDGQPSASANGDDTDGQDDENGVVLPASLQSGTNNISVIASAPGLLSAWVDYDGDGDWTGNQVIKDQPVASGTNNLQLELPGITQDVVAPARFRLSTQSGLWFDGSAPNGEVEDYVVDVTQGAPQVDFVRINGGDTQRSSVTSVEVVFDRLVDIGSGAISITNTGIPLGDSSTPVTGLVVDSNPVGGVTVATITFGAGDSVVTRNTANTLDDGNYRLDINASLVTAQGGGPAMAADYQFGSVEADNFYRLYGDADGTGNTDFLDFSDAFLPAFGTGQGQTGYRDEMDFNGDGLVDFLDFSDGFLPNFGTGRNPPS